MSPDLSPVATLLGVNEPTVRAVLASWGPGKFDAELFLDGKAFQPGGASAATVIPPAFGLSGVNLHTYTGWGSIPYWNAFVANLEMHGVGRFFDPRLENAAQFPIAAAHGFGDLPHINPDDDLITSKLSDLQFYQLAIFSAKCASCHVPPLYTEPGWNLHTGAEIGIDDFQASRSPDGRYRTTPLRGLFTRAKGGFYHDGRFATLTDVVDHYDSALGLSLSQAQKSDLVEFLKSL